MGSSPTGSTTNLLWSSIAGVFSLFGRTHFAGSNPAFLREVAEWQTQWTDNPSVGNHRLSDLYATRKSPAAETKPIAKTYPYWRSVHTDTLRQRRPGSNPALAWIGPPGACLRARSTLSPQGDAAPTCTSWNTHARRLLIESIYAVSDPAFGRAVHYLLLCLVLRFTSAKTKHRYMESTMLPQAKRRLRRKGVGQIIERR